MAKICIDNGSKQRIGQEAEDEFDKTWTCPYCHEWPFVDFVHQKPPLPDRICPNCGLEVDIKGSPEALDYGKITISQIPFDKWHPGVVIAWRPNPGEWYGTRKYFCNAKGPFKPTIDGKRPTSFYKIDIEAFDPLEKILKRKP